MYPAKGIIPEGGTPTLDLMRCAASSGCPFMEKIMRQGVFFLLKLLHRVLQLIKQLCNMVSCRKEIVRILLERSMMQTFGKIFMRKSILLAHLSRDRVQCVERISTHPHHFPNQVSPEVSLLYC